MADILEATENVWYREIVAGAFYSESDYERTILSYLQKHLTEYFVVKCKMDIYNRKERKSFQPDLALIRHDYKEWYIVEVEMSSHSLVHPIKQISTFCFAEYLGSHAEYIYNIDRGLFNFQRLSDMVKGIPPKVLLIIDSFSNKWKEALNDYEVEIAVFQIYYSKNQNRLYRFKGAFPSIDGDFCHCLLTTGVPLLLNIIEPEYLNARSVYEGENIEIEYLSKVCIYRRIRIGRKDYLECLAPILPLDPLRKRYILYFDNATGLFHFKNV